jgi:hypothetical protein
MDPEPPLTGAERGLDVERDSDVPISTQIYWQLASDRLQPGDASRSRLGAARQVTEHDRRLSAPR